MKKIITLIILISSLIGFAQTETSFTATEKAYLYHVVKKSPILNNNIGRYFEYTGRDVRLPNGEVNFDSIETIIIYDPSTLYFRAYEIAKSPKGILAETANKMALWELNVVLKSKRKNNLEKDGLEGKYDEFEKVLRGHFPASAFKTKKDGKIINKRFDNVLDPSITFDNKVTMLSAMNFLSLTEQKQVLDAIKLAINTYVSDRSLEIFKALGGEADMYLNFLTAAGDGGMTSGLFEEREKDEKGRYNKGLPKAVGLFPYESTMGERKEGKRKTTKKIEPQRYTSTIFETTGNNKATNIHLDVWGYNSAKQTTVVIERNGLCYPLFGTVDSRFLSPDSTYGGEMTYYSIIKSLDRDIEKMNEMIHGKRGYDYWIAHYEEEKGKTKIDIDEKEGKLAKLRGKTTIITKTKKKKGKYVTSTKDGGGKRREMQEEVLQLHAHWQFCKSKVKELTYEKENAMLILESLERKRTRCLNLVGRKWSSYTVEDGLFVFEDSCTFDLYTQEFMIPATEESESIDIRLLAIPFSYSSTEADEVMMHINVTDALPRYNSRVRIDATDLFGSNKYNLTQTLIQEKDSVAVLQFFEALLNKKSDFDIIIRGQGVAKWNGAEVVKDYRPREIDAYPTPAHRDSLEFKRLRLTEIYVNLNRGIKLEINCYTDPVETDFSVNSEKVNSALKEYNFNNNDVLSLYRSYSTAKQLKQELNVLASKYLSREDAKKVIDRLNKEFKSTKYNMGRVSFKEKNL